MKPIRITLAVWGQCRITGHTSDPPRTERWILHSGWRPSMGRHDLWEVRITSGPRGYLGPRHLSFLAAARAALQWRAP